MALPTEWFFFDDSRLLWRIVNDGWRDEVPIRRFDFTTDSYLQLLSFYFSKEAFDTLVLHSILQRAMAHAFQRAISGLQSFHMLNESFTKLSVDGFVHVNTLYAEARLTRIQESIECDLRALELASKGGDGWIGRTSGTVFAMSTSGKMIAGSFPPLFSISMIFPKMLAGGSQFQSNTLQCFACTFITNFPVAVEPAKLILSIPGWLVIHGPR